MTGYQALVVLVVAFTLAGAALLISLRANKVSENRERAARLESERAWCAVLVTLDDAYRIPGQEPKTSTGRNVAEAISALRGRNCPPQSFNAPLPSTKKSE